MKKGEKFEGAKNSKYADEYLAMLDGKEKVVLCGCGGCATVFHTGGEPEVKQMADLLSHHGRKVLAAIAPPFGEFTCYTPWSKERLNRYRQQIEECDAILMLSCGDGLQVVREFVLENEFGLIKPIYPATNPIGHMGGGPSAFREKCMQCGECLLGQFAGICPMTQCAKGLLNGPCGGASNGKCEADPERDCAWELIYHRLKKLGELDKWRKAGSVIKDYSKMARPRRIEVAPL